MGSLTVARWAKYGKDRLYVNATTGQRVGWYDMKTGQATIELPTHETEFHTAVSEYLASHPQPPGPRPGVIPEQGGAVRPGPRSDVSTLPPPQLSPGPTFEAAVDPETAPREKSTDLAGNRPGQAARAQADAHLAEMKSRSKVGTWIARAVDAKTDERAWRVGADGEESVGARLDKLRNHGWQVLHSVPVGDRGSDIDHVLIGPGGVFTVNTKNHPGKIIWVSPTQIRVDGHPVPYLRNSRFEADRTRRLLTAALGWEPPVKPVLVLLTGTLLPQVTIKSGGPDDVAILDRMDIPGAFKRAKQRLDVAQVVEIHEQARRPSTWTRRA